MSAIFEFLAPIGLNESNFQFMLIAAILGLSIYITLYGGMFSLANGGFMGIGAYTAVILTQQYSYDFGFAIFLGGVVAGLIAIPIGLPVLRLNDIYLAIATIGFGEIVVVVIRNLDRLYDIFYEDLLNREVPANLPSSGGATGIKGIPVQTETWHLILLIALLAYFFYRLHRSRFGRALTAIRQDPNVASNMGINVVYYKNAAFIIGAIIAGWAGGLSGHLTRIIIPETYGFNQVVDILTYAVLGGTYTLIGPIVGGMVLEYIPEFLRRVELLEILSDIVGRDLTENRAAVDGVINGAVLIIFVIYLPRGLVDPQLWTKIRTRLTQGKPSDA